MRHYAFFTIDYDRRNTSRSSAALVSMKKQSVYEKAATCCMSSFIWDTKRRDVWPQLFWLFQLAINNAALLQRQNFASTTKFTGPSPPKPGACISSLPWLPSCAFRRRQNRVGAQHHRIGQIHGQTSPSLPCANPNYPKAYTPYAQTKILGRLYRSRLHVSFHR